MKPFLPYLLSRILRSKPIHSILFGERGYAVLGSLLLVLEGFLCSYILLRIKYTEIDWVAYMQEVKGFLNGTLDYNLLKGQTGPCVYPAGFLYIYALLYRVTRAGTDLFTGQVIFAGLYLVNLLLVFNIYRLSKQVPPFAMVFMCCFSYRIHSIYLLRLFNDPITMLALYACMNAILYNRFTIASLLFSLAVSVKMNALLFAPGLLIVLLMQRGILETVGHLCECAIVQLLLGMPFLFHNPSAYLSAAFNLGRQFMYQWTVNWRLIPEHLFLDYRFHLALLTIHFILLLLLLGRFIRKKCGFSRLLRLYPSEVAGPNDPSSVLYPMFVANFAGIVVSRSLHYQFYVWYFHSLPYLLWSIERMPTSVRLLLLGLIEICWNTFPSTRWSSLLLHICHFVVLLGLLFFQQAKTVLIEAEKIPAQNTIKVENDTNSKQIVSGKTKKRVNVNRSKLKKQ